MVDESELITPGTLCGLQEGMECRVAQALTLMSGWACAKVCTTSTGELLPCFCVPDSVVSNSLYHLFRQYAQCSIPAGSGILDMDLSIQLKPAVFWWALCRPVLHGQNLHSASKLV